MIYYSTAKWVQQARPAHEHHVLRIEGGPKGYVPVGDPEPIGVRADGHVVWRQMFCYADDKPDPLADPPDKYAALVLLLLVVGVVSGLLVFYLG